MAAGDMHITIRPYRNLDRKTVSKLICDMQRAMMAFDEVRERDIKQGYGEAVLSEMLRAVSSRKECLYVAVAGSEVVGYVNGSRPGKPSRSELLGRRSPARIFGEVEMIYIAPEYRRTSAGTMLMKKAEEWLKRNGCNVVVVHYYSANRKAVPFYKKLGYRCRSMMSYKEV